jgi:hypothetical protein
MDEIKDLKAVVKEKLGDLLTPEMETKLGDEKVLLDAKNFVPLSKLEKESGLVKSLNEQLEAKEKLLQDTITQRDKDLKKLAKDAEGNPELVKKFEDQIKANKEESDALKIQNEEIKTKSLNDKKHLAVLEMLMDNEVLKPTHRTMLAREIELSIGLDKIELDEIGKVKKSDEIMKPYKENPDYSGFIGKTVAIGQRHVQGEIDMSGDLFTREQLNSLTKEQLLDPKVMAKADKSYAVIGKV